MKLLQAIVTSSPETLDDRQGFGLVVCSRAMPEAVKKAAREWEYPAEGDGTPVYSFMLLVDRETTWAVMNHTIPATDFTGRSSYVSHTLAIRKDELSEYFDQPAEATVTPFEVMLHFDWKGSWRETDSPHYIEKEDDVEIDESFFQRRIHEPFFAEGVKSAPLLAFDFSTPDCVKPKRLGWNVGDLVAEDILRLFHSAWITVDPWRGGKKYGDHLGEPRVSLADSWSCAFTTNLRGERPDAYQWVVLGAEQKTMASREVIDIADWKGIDEQAVADQIGGEMGVLLVERSRDPDGWARSVIERRIADIARSYEERFGALVADKKEQIKAVIENVRKDVDSWNGFVKTDRDSSKKVASGHLESWRAEISGYEDTLTSNNQNLFDELKMKVAPLNNLLQRSNLDGAESPAVTLFPELRNQFGKLSEDFRRIYPYGLALRGMREIEKELILLKSQNKDLLGKNTGLALEEKKLKKAVKSLVEQKSEKAVGNPRPKGEKKPKNESPGWHLYALAFASALVVLLSGYIFMIKFSDQPPNVSSSDNQRNGDKQSSKREVAAQALEIDTLKTERDEARKSLVDKKEINKIELGQKDKEIQRLKIDLTKLKDKLEAIQPGKNPTEQPLQSKDAAPKDKDTKPGKEAKSDPAAADKAEPPTKLADPAAEAEGGNKADDKRSQGQ